MRHLPFVLPISIVPTGLVLNLMHNPGTKVPGYFPRVPLGRKMAKLQSSPFQHQAHLRCSQWGGNLADDVTLNSSVIITTVRLINCRFLETY
jgi:hypothetical protein